MCNADPSVPAYELTKVFASYVQLLFVSKIHVLITPPLPPPQLSILADAEMITTKMVAAFNNPILLPDWDFARMGQKVPLSGQAGAAREATLQDQFPPQYSHHIEHPCIIEDKFGNVGMWYLPGVLARRHQDIILSEAENLNGLIRQGIEKNSKSKASWRTTKQNFTEGVQIQPGNVNFSPAWFEQGKEGPNFPLHTSPTLDCTKQGKSTYSWLVNTMETSVVLGGILSVIHPQLFNAGMECLKKLWDKPEQVRTAGLHDVLLLWSSPFSGHSLICNRQTPTHRDPQVCLYGFDILATVGNYIGATFRLTDIGLSFGYASGTVVGLLSALIRHEVDRHVGDRVVLANYMQDRPLARIGIEAPYLVKRSEWAMYEDFCKWYDASAGTNTAGNSLRPCDADNVALANEVAAQFLNLSKFC